MNNIKNLNNAANDNDFTKDKAIKLLETFYEHFLNTHNFNNNTIILIIF